MGYFGLGGGADLNIVIRTAVQWGDEIIVGADGAIVLPSEPQAEYDEMILKALAPLRALAIPDELPCRITLPGTGGGSDPARDPATQGLASAAPRSAEIGG